MNEENLIDIWKWRLNDNQRIIFSILAIRLKQTNVHFVDYEELTNPVVENIKRYNHNATNKSMGGWVAKLNNAGFTYPFKSTEVTRPSGRDKEQKSLAITDLGDKFLRKHLDIIKDYIQEKEINEFD